MLTEDAVKKVLIEAFRGKPAPKLFPRVGEIRQEARQAGKSARAKALREALADTYVVNGDSMVVGTWRIGNGPPYAMLDVRDEPATPPATPEPPAKVLHHNRGFFPNKIGRIDVLPRYPGVWG